MLILEFGRALTAGNAGPAGLCCLAGWLMFGAGPRRQYIDPALRMAVAEGIECPSQVFAGIDAVEAAGLHQRRDDGPLLRPLLATG